MQYFNELLNILNAMSPYLLLGFFVAGVLHVYIPKRLFSRYLSKKGGKSILLAALCGVPLPLCSCGVIPTAMSLKKEGATDGATVSFLISTPQTGVDSILATYSLLGLPFAIIRPIVALIVGVMGGLFTDRLSSKSDRDIEQKEKNYTESRPTLIDALKYGFVDMLQDLGKWLSIGLIIAAAITAFVPSGLFEILSDHYALNIIVVLLLSIPMYICSTGSIPIALSLLMMGISPGAALIFLMAGPATNVSTLAVVNKVLGTRTTILYLLSIVIGAIGFALLIDFVLPSEWFALKIAGSSVGCECSDGVAWWHTASSILFILLLINAYILKFWRGVTHTHEIIEPSTQRFKVTGMRCNHCKANIERSILSLPDVVSITTDLASGVVEVEGNVSSEEVCRAIRELGFEAAHID